ncbi:MAG: SurA N-terminal domain-containing protein [Nocardioides sp.]|nr:SurA N-terminal domain-containing protein [Nocardioides sp.]
MRTRPVLTRRGPTGRGPSRLAHSLTALAAGGLLVTTLSGCGSDLAPTMHPGSAAVVGDESISFSSVDDLSKDACGIYSAISGGPGTKAMVRGQVLSMEISRSKAEQYADEFGINPNPYVRVQQQQLDQTLDKTELSDSEKQTARDFVEPGIYAEAVRIAVGRGDLPVATSGKDLQAARDKGAPVVDEWTKKLDVETDPRFPVQEAQGFKLDPASLSVAVSDQAVSATDAKAVQSNLASMPASQKCE